MKRLFPLVVMLLWLASLAQAQTEPVIDAVDVSLVERWRIPGEIGGQAFGRIVSVAVGEDGQVFLIDGKHSRVYAVSDKTGALIDSFGKEGDGPGDLHRAQFASSSEKDRLDVVCLAPPSVQSLTYAGGYLEDRRLDFGKKFLVASLSRALPVIGGYVISGMAVDVNMSQAFFVAPATAGLEMSSPFVLKKVSDQGKTRLYDITFDAPRWVINGTDIFISSEHSQYRIDVYGFNGSVRRQIRHKYDHLPRPRSEIESLKKHFRDAGKSGAAVDPSVEPFCRDIEDMYVLPGGQLLVLSSRGIRASKEKVLGEFDVLDAATGSLVQRVRMHGEGSPFFDNYIVSGSRLFVVTDMQPSARSLGHADNRELPYMTVICYELRIAL